MERITLNLIPKGIKPICHASQYDKGRQIALDLMDDLQGYILSTEEIELGVCKPDGNIVTAAIEVTEGATFVIMETTEQMTACEGDSECELRITKDGAEIGTLNFILRTERYPLEDGIESDTEIHNLTNQIHDINEEMLPDMVAEEVANQYDSQNVIFDDHPTAGHGTGYVVKSENVPDELNDLTDIDIDNPQSNQALVYNPETGKWENGEVSTVGSIDDLDDVDTTGAAEGTSLVAKEENGDIIWKPKKTIIELTAAEYAALKAGGNLQPDTEYLLKDAPALIPTAEDIEYDTGTTVKEAIDGLKVERQYYTGTTSGYGNLALGAEFDSNTKVIISATARNKANTNTVYIADIYQNDVNRFGTTYGLHLRNITDNSAVANTAVEGYIWLVKFS